MAAYFRHLIFSASLLLSLGVHAQQTSDEDYQSKLKELQSTINAIKSELTEVKGSRNELHKELEKSEVGIGKLTRKINHLEEELRQQKKQLMQLNKKRNELQVAKREQQEQIGQQLNAAYRLGQQSHIKLLLNQENPDELARTMKYYELFTEARSKKVDAYLATLSELDSIEPQITAKAEALQQSREKLQQRHSQLQSSQTERKQTLARLNQSIANKDQQLKNMALDQQRLQRLLETVTTAIANLSLADDGQPFSKRKGKMLYPTKGKISNRYGSARITEQLRWEGLMIKAAEGSDVNAIHHGRVVFADYLRGHGLLLILDHGDGYMSLYAHNQSLLKETGDWVGSGENIARVGNSGGQTQAGLYFEIRHQGEPTNPSRWCRSS